MRGRERSQTRRAGDKRGRQEEPENERRQITGEKERETEANTKRTTLKITHPELR